MSTLSAISTGISAITNLILVSPQNTIGYQPQPIVTKDGTKSPNPPALLFNYEGEQTATLDSDITDHYIENNTAIQDQIALRPVIITTQGFIGELNDLPPNSLFAAAYVAAQKLTAISAYTPGLSTTALLAYNEAVFAYSTANNLINSAVSAWSSITGSGGESFIDSNGLHAQPNQTQQQKYFQQFYGYWSTRTLFTVQTPWAIFENMAIKSLKAVQSGETNVITDFEVTFKQLRFASTLDTTTLYSDNFNFQARLQNQGASLTNLGTSALTTSPVTFASSLAGVS